MLFVNAEFIENKTLKRLIQHIVYLLLLMIAIPFYWVFEIIIVLPGVVQENSVPYYFNLILGFFLLTNTVGNLIFGAMGSTSVNERILCYEDKTDWTFCSKCETLRPPRSWHCKICDVCILKRDHHCVFLATCVGHYNQRYFFFFTFYAFFSTLYASFYNIVFFYKYTTWNRYLILKIMFPMFYLVFDYNIENLTVLIMIISFVVLLTTGILVRYHFRNILGGYISPEISKRDNIYRYDKGWRNNLKEVFGTKWYLTWISPFIKSPLPCDGVNWDYADKEK